MPKIPADVRAVLDTILFSGIGWGLVLALDIVVLHAAFQWYWMFLGACIIISNVLYGAARTRPRLRVALRAGVWSIPMTGVIWIFCVLLLSDVRAVLNLSFSDSEMDWWALILSAIGALLSGLYLYHVMLHDLEA